MLNLESSIIRTLAFFSNFKHPLTSTELYRWLWKPPKITYSDFLDKLDNSILNNSSINRKDSFYFLSGNQGFVQIRQSRVKLAKKKLDIARKAVKKLRYIPFLDAVFVCNTLALGAVNEDSDIDFFLICQPDRVWLVRFFANIILKSLGLRVGGGQEKDKICLSFFISSDNLDLSQIQIPQTPDIYLIYWIDQLIPLFDTSNIYQKIYESNEWIKEYLPNINKRKGSIYQKEVEYSKFSNLCSNIGEKLWQGNYGNLIDNQAKGLQEKKLEFYLQDNYAENEPDVIIEKNIIKLHENDRRSEFRQHWLKIIQKFN